MVTVERQGQSLSILVISSMYMWVVSYFVRGLWSGTLEIDDGNRGNVSQFYSSKSIPFITKFFVRKNVSRLLDISC